MPMESKISKTLSDRTTRTVIILILMMLFLMPLMQEDTYIQWESYGKSLGQIESIYQKLGENNPYYQQACEEFTNYNADGSHPIIRFEAPGRPLWTGSAEVSDLRIDEYEKFESGEFIAYMNNRVESIANAYISMSRTIFICILLSVGALFFSRDAEKLVLNPIERMIEKVKKIAENPLAATTGELENAGFLSMTENMNKKKSKKKVEQLETHVLEDTIMKIGYLLALGFGEAGSEIIAKNMKSGGELNPMAAGQKVMAIFGFCDIHHFAEANEVLDTEIMVFVNTIADTVHAQVDRYGGSANKNIGEAFLMIWKFKKEDVKRKGKSVKLRS